MSDEKDKSALGKQFRGQKFVAVKTADDVQAELDAQKPFDKPDAVPIEAYFAHARVRDPVKQASMRAFTMVRRATLEDWRSIFERF